MTACDLTAVNVGDAQAAAGLVASEPDRLEVLADSAYGAGEFRPTLAAAEHTAQSKPIPCEDTSMVASPSTTSRSISPPGS